MGSDGCDLQLRLWSGDEPQPQGQGKGQGQGALVLVAEGVRGSGRVARREWAKRERHEEGEEGEDKGGEEDGEVLEGGEVRVPGAWVCLLTEGERVPSARSCLESEGEGRPSAEAVPFKHRGVPDPAQARGSPHNAQRSPPQSTPSNPAPSLSTDVNIQKTFTSHYLEPTHQPQDKPPKGLHHSTSNPLPAPSRSTTSTPSLSLSADIRPQETLPHHHLTPWMGPQHPFLSLLPGSSGPQADRHLASSTINPTPTSFPNQPHLVSTTLGSSLSSNIQNQTQIAFPITHLGPHHHLLSLAGSTDAPTASAHVPAWHLPPAGHVADSSTTAAVPAVTAVPATTAVPVVPTVAVVQREAVYRPEGIGLLPSQLSQLAQLAQQAQQGESSGALSPAQMFLRYRRHHSGVSNPGQHLQKFQLPRAELHLTRSDLQHLRITLPAKQPQEPQLAAAFQQEQITDPLSHRGGVGEEGVKREKESEVGYSLCSPNPENSSSRVSRPNLNSRGGFSPLGASGAKATPTVSLATPRGSLPAQHQGSLRRQGRSEIVPLRSWLGGPATELPHSSLNSQSSLFSPSLLPSLQTERVRSQDSLLSPSSPPAINASRHRALLPSTSLPSTFPPPPSHVAAASGIVHNPNLQTAYGAPPPQQHQTPQHRISNSNTNNRSITGNDRTPDNSQSMSVGEEEGEGRLAERGGGSEHAVVRGRGGHGEGRGGQEERKTEGGRVVPVLIPRSPWARFMVDQHNRKQQGKAGGNQGAGRREMGGTHHERGGSQPSQHGAGSHTDAGTDAGDTSGQTAPVPEAVTNPASAQTALPNSTPFTASHGGSVPGEVTGSLGGSSSTRVRTAPRRGAAAHATPEADTEMPTVALATTLAHTAAPHASIAEPAAKEAQSSGSQSRSGWGDGNSSRSRKRGSEARGGVEGEGLGGMPEGSAPPRPRHHSRGPLQWSPDSPPSAHRGPHTLKTEAHLGRPKEESPLLAPSLSWPVASGGGLGGTPQTGAHPGHTPKSLHALQGLARSAASTGSLLPVGGAVVPGASGSTGIPVGGAVVPGASGSIETPVGGALAPGLSGSAGMPPGHHFEDGLAALLRSLAAPSQGLGLGLP